MYRRPKSICSVRNWNKSFGGVGISVQIDELTGRLLIVSPLYNTPAYTAGIMPGDIILEIDGGQLLAKMSMQEATDRCVGRSAKRCG